MSSDSVKSKTVVTAIGSIGVAIISTIVAKTIVTSVVSGGSFGLRVGFSITTFTSSAWNGNVGSVYTGGTFDSKSTIGTIGITIVATISTKTISISVCSQTISVAVVAMVCVSVQESRICFSLSLGIGGSQKSSDNCNLKKIMMKVIRFF